MTRKLKAAIVYVAIAVVSVAFIAASVLVSGHEESLLSALVNTHNTSAFLKELGFAGIIAVIVIFTVESFSKERHNQEQSEFVEQLIGKMNRSMFLAMYNRNLPKSIFGQIEHLILSANCYRRNYQIDYTLGLIGDMPSHFRATVQTKYMLFSTADKTIEHTLRINLENPIDASHLTYCGVQAIQIDDKSLSKDDIDRYTINNGIQQKFQFR